MFKKIAAGVVLTLGASVSPVIPAKNGLISVALCTSQSGYTYEKISDAQFENMKGEGGSQFNPTCSTGTYRGLSYQLPYRDQPALTHEKTSTSTPIAQQFPPLFDDDFDTTTTVVELLTTKAEAAVSFNHVSSSSSGGSGATSVILSHDATGDDMLICSINARQSGGSGTPGTVSVTYNGVSMTRIVDNQSSTNFTFLSAFKLASPSTGTNNASFSWTNSSRYGVGCTSYSGVSSVGTPTTTSGSGAAPSLSKTISTGDMVLGLYAVPDVATAFSVTTGTERLEQADGSFIALGQASNTGSGSVSVTYAYSGSDTWQYALVDLIQTATASPDDGMMLFE